MRSVWTPGVTLEMFARTVDIDYGQLQERCRRLCELYENVVTVEVTAPAGTDLVIPVAGRRPFRDDGDFSRPGTGGNIPAGEVFISPVVGNGTDAGCAGRIAFDGSIVKSAISLMPDATYELPYEGAKEMLFVDDVDNKDFLTQLFNAMYEELPNPKKKK